MVITKSYKLVRKIDSPDTYYVQNEEIPVCPCCGERLRVAGNRRRNIYKADGSKSILIVRRLFCKRCSCIHHELPDIVAPYKRYSIAAIETALQSSKKSCCENNFPGEDSTIYRLRKWFILLCEHVLSVLHSLNAFHELTKKIKKWRMGYLPFEEQGWLSAFICDLLSIGVIYRPVSH